VRLRSPGLRARLVLALVATSAVTLIVATVAIVPPLEHRLANDRLRDMREEARTARLALERIPARDLRPGATPQRDVVRDLAERMGGRVALIDAQGREIADTDPGRPDPRSGRPERLEDAGFARAGDVRDQIRDEEAVVVAGVRSHAGRLTLVLRKSLTDTRAAAAVVRREVIVAASVGLALAIALGVALAFGLLRRLERLRRGARRLADEGVERPLELKAGRDEVGEVAEALEAMRARLHASERGRQAFLSTASHELRTPLASLQGTVELLEEELARGAPDLDAARRRAATAHRQTERLTTLAADLLDLGRLDAVAPLAVEPVELGELAGTIAAESEAAAAAAGVAVRVRAPAPAWVRADPRAVARLLRALLDNALRHGSPSLTTITVGVAPEGDRGVVSVADDGPGLPEDDRERVFGRFERGDTAGPGFGLGLPIARGLARRMGGDVRAEPAPRGARFVAWLPACPAPAGAGEPHRSLTAAR
jgi:signal transduction histidine kinase